MRSFQNLMLLQNLYRIKAAGFNYIDPIAINHRTEQQLPDDIGMLGQMVAQCHLCDLSKSRRQSMAGFGNPHADLVFVDYTVSMAEDESNSYYAGKSGFSLRQMIEKVLGLRVEDVFLTHAIKCKPLGANLPSASEWNSCKAYLFKQLEVIAPRVVVTLGPDAYRLFATDDAPFEQVRGQRINFGGFTVVPIYHPGFLLRNPSLKKATMLDLHAIKSAL